MYGLLHGQGELEEQSQKKQQKYFPNLDSKNLKDTLLNGINAKDILFINWETITKIGNTALKEGEKRNLKESITEGKNKGLSYIAIIDEEHRNKTYKAENVVDFIKPKYVVRVSATPKPNLESEFIEIEESEVIASGLITKYLYINEAISNVEIQENEHEYLIDLALNKRKEIFEEYKANDIKVNPLIMIQFPNESEIFIKQIEKILEKNGIIYGNRTLAKWLSTNHTNLENISENMGEQQVLIMKQAVATGWDCPRAKILVKLRDNMEESFEVQVIGRIRRMPQAKHYENRLLDNCYLYTLDKKWSDGVIKELGENARIPKVVYLKDEFADFKLTKEYFEEQSKFDEKETFTILFDYMKKKYGLIADRAKNIINLQIKNGYKFTENVENNILQGQVASLEQIKNVEMLKIQFKVNSDKDWFNYMNAVSNIGDKVGIRSDRMRKMLDRMFWKTPPFFDIKTVKINFIKQNKNNYYAFIINNEEKLKEDFFEAVNTKARQIMMDIKSTKNYEWHFPKEDLIKYDKDSKDRVIYNKNVFMQYPSNISKFRSENMFEEFCKNNSNIKWFCKNGESSKEYFSIPYNDNVKKWNFYVDYILEDIQGRIWLIETKGGETTSGTSKNIDKRAENKYEALKIYAEKYNLQFGFVRDYDKNNKLYICNTEYTDDMGGENWIKLEEIF